MDIFVYISFAQIKTNEYLRVFSKLLNNDFEIWYLIILGRAPDTEIGRVYVNDPDDWDLPDKKFQFKNPGKWKDKFRLDTNTGMITMLRSIYLPKEINQFEIDFIVEDPTHRQFGKDAVTAKVNIFNARTVIKLESVNTQRNS